MKLEKNHQVGEKLTSKSNIEEMTVFVVTYKEKTISECLKALNNQSCTFNLKIIKNLYPMSSAFQYMPDNCKTKFFIQVDGDMILKKNAIKKLYETMLKQPFFIYRVSYPLQEKGFGKAGAIKCWRKSIFKFFKFSDSRTVDRTFHNKVKLIGLKYRHYDEILGEHKSKVDNFSTYLKSKSNIEKWKYLKKPFEQYAKNYLQKSFENKYEFLGTVLGAITFQTNLKRSKNIFYEEKFYRKLNFFFLNKSKFNKKNIDKEKILELFKNNYSCFSSDNTELKKNLLNEIQKIFKMNKIDHNIFFKIYD